MIHPLSTIPHVPLPVGGCLMAPFELGFTLLWREMLETSGDDLYGAN